MSILNGITRPGHQCEATNPTGFDNHTLGRMYNRCRFEVVNPAGETVQRTPWQYNIMNTYGLDSLAKMIGSGAGKVASTWISACRIGTGTTAATSTDTSLVASTGLVVITAGTNIMTNTHAGARTLEYRMTFASTNPTGSATINEIALYCDSTATANNLACRANVAAVSKSSRSDTIQCSFDIVFATA